MLRTAFPACCIVFAVTCAPAQTSDLPAFDAATIKPTTLPDGSSSWHTRTGYAVMKGQSLRALTAIAYQVSKDRVTGGPKWDDTDRYDIEARSAGPAQDAELLRMLQRLLADRFRMTFHRENRTTDGYSLVPLKSGLKIKPDTTAGNASSNSKRGFLDVQHIPMSKFAEMLSRFLGVPVIDDTGAQGLYTFKLEFASVSPPAAVPGNAPPDPGGPTLFDVVAHQLGLKLENKKMPVEVIVIDKAEKPDEN